MRFSHSGYEGEPEAGSAADAGDGDSWGVPRPGHVPAAPGTRCLSVSSTRGGGGKTRSGLEHDITCIRLAQGFACLVAILDGFSRYVLSFRLSNSLETFFCREALDEALEIGTPEIFNTDQGCNRCRYLPMIDSQVVT